MLRSFEHARSEHERYRKIQTRIHASRFRGIVGHEKITSFMIKIESKFSEHKFRKKKIDAEELF